MATSHLRIVQQFLKTRKGPVDIPETGFPFITISRQSGAGTHELCDILLEDFGRQPSDVFRGWHVFDRLICEAVAQDPGISRCIEDLIKEHYESEFQSLMDSLIAGSAGSYRLYKKTFQVIAMLATIGKVIIVGRAGCCVTASFPSAVHLRLVAPEDQCLAATMKRLKVGREEAGRLLKRKETERRRLVKTFFGREIDDPLLYDATWNTGKADLHEISESVVALIKRRAERTA